VDAHRTRSYLPLVHSVFVSGHRRATDLDWSVPANDREAVDLRAAVCGMDCLFAGVVAITELLVAQRATSTSERRILRTLAGSFVAIAILILASLGLGLGKGTIAGQYLQTFANLGSLLPSALLAYYIYRYRYLELIIKESLI